MRTLPLRWALALAVATIPPAVGAQDQGAAMDHGAAIAADHRAAYDAWPADQRTAYDAWPADLRTYYWTLTPTQQQGWWRLTDEQRAMVHGLAPDQRSAAWQSIEAQMGTPPSAPAAESTPGNWSPPPPAAMNKTYPVCSRTVQDSCQNPGEGGARGRSRALNYWPGKPASE